MPLWINGGFVCTVTGNKQYVHIIPESPGLVINQVQYDSSKGKAEVTLDCITENSYQFRYGKAVINIEKFNKETELQREILDLKTQLKSIH
ncbi:MAG: hypothetical protein QT11_C0001G0823 [archaeon GW2011_AR20]|nr:MAG: hypothetical protein QT11_C0001G0823 [archaeon GW2011_AR20]MBS3160771.1 hypothetical protein [Candidatus Woesearchaeota archaeon]